MNKLKIAVMFGVLIMVFLIITHYIIVLDARKKAASRNHYSPSAPAFRYNNDLSEAQKKEGSRNPNNPSGHVFRFGDYTADPKGDK